MTFSRVDSWVWDFWVADDGEQFHLFYLFAPRSLGDPELRHRNARIGHATSGDLLEWLDHGEVLRPGSAGAFDATATWTGSVVRGDDGLWRMFYTGSVFTSPESGENVESIGVATSPDLVEWTKQSDEVLRADARWYECLGDSEWPEEAWRDPWVYRDPAGDGWHMLITARSREGHFRQRGVVGHAWSSDLTGWEVCPPLSPLVSRFEHLEVLQLVEVEGANSLLFSAAVDGVPGVWLVDDVPPVGPFDVDSAVALTGEGLYSGRVVLTRMGEPVLLAFEYDASAAFRGTISDPLALRRDGEGRLGFVAAPAR